MNKNAVNGTNMNTSCQIRFDGSNYYVVACHQYYDENYDSVEEFEFIASGVTAEGELVDSGFSQGNVSAREDQIVDYGSVAELILRGWGNLFPTIENDGTFKALAKLKAKKEADLLEEQKLDGIKNVTVSVLREGLKIDKFNIRMAGLINRRTRAIRLMFSCESFGHLHLCEEMEIPSSATGWVRFEWYPMTGKITCRSSYDERGMEETLPQDEYQEILQYLKENLVIDDNHTFHRYREYVFDGTNWCVAKNLCSKQGYASDWQHSINAGLKASGVDTTGLEPFDPWDDDEFD